MPSFTNGDVEIAYLDEGEGEPIVLVHGFASTKEINWAQPGWIGTLNRAGRRAVALDNRGHGASSKLYDPAAYHSAAMADDVRALLNHLKIERADIIGYSMGGMQASTIGLNHPEVFAYVAAMSGNARESALTKALADPERTNKDFKLIWLGCGTDDNAVNGGRALDKVLTNKGIHHEWVESPGYRHDYQIWRIYLRDLLPKLFRD